MFQCTKLLWGHSPGSHLLFAKTSFHAEIYKHKVTRMTPATLSQDDTFLSQDDICRCQYGTIAVQLKPVFRLRLSLVELVLRPLVLQLKLTLFRLDTLTQHPVIGC